MKDIYFVQRNWRDDFFAPLAVAEGWDAATQGLMRYQIGKEVEWLIRMRNPQGSVELRLAKIAMLLEAHDGDMSSFDPYWASRQAFYQYVLA